MELFDKVKIIDGPFKDIEGFVLALKEGVVIVDAEYHPALIVATTSNVEKI